MPDIDLDFCFERRGEILEYARERYGRESVGQIITFGTLKARAAFRDVARTLRVEMGDVERLTKLIPSGPAFSVTLAEAPEKVPEVKAAAAQDERIRKVLDLGARIEGLARHASVHAAGVVIAPGPLTDYVPVCTAPDSKTDADAIITQYDMVGLEQIGMLKIDLLGLKTLTVLHDATRMVAERHGVTIDLERPDLNDPAVYALLRSGRTAGIFQFESPLATDCLRNMKCDRFEDLVATNALLRPGPLDTGMHLVFINRKLGREPVRYPHPALEEILAPTYGVITYQEQVMRIANVLAGFSLAEADVLRKAVGKKDRELIQEELGRFVERAVANGHARRVVEEIAAQIATFGRYGCNKRVLEALIDAGACDSLGGHRAQLVAALEDAFAEAQARQAEREAGQVGMFGEEAPISHPASRIPDVPAWTEHERLAREKAVLGFFISGHPLANYRTEVELFGTRTTATLGLWSDQKVRLAAVVTVVKRQLSKKSGAEYARLVFEEFHGTAEALVFPEAWAKLNDVIRPDQALLLSGGHSARDRDEEQAPFIVDGAQPLDELRAKGAIGVALVWTRTAPPPPDAARAVAALCAAHPGPCPVLVEWAEADENGASPGREPGADPGRQPGGGPQPSVARLRSRSLRVEAADDLLAALRGLLGPDHVHLVRTT